MRVGAASPGAARAAVKCGAGAGADATRRLLLRRHGAAPPLDAHRLPAALATPAATTQNVKPSLRAVHHSAPPDPH